MQDLSAVALEVLGRLWPTELRDQLKGLGVATVGEFLALSPLDVITAPGSDRGLLHAVIGEINDWKQDTERYMGVTEDDLERFQHRSGFTRPIAPARGAPATSWGSMYAHCVAPEQEVGVSDWCEREISSVLEALCAQRGIAASHTAPQGFDPLRRRRTLPGSDPTDPLANDAIMLSCSGIDWYRVQSLRWSHSACGRNPLALALSTRFPVIAIAAVAERYTELALYTAGALVRISVNGPAPRDDVPNADGFDAEALASAIDLTLRIDEANLRKQLEHCADESFAASSLAQSWWAEPFQRLFTG
jgi:hypothetical protein